MIIVLWSGIEVVITRLTRNQLYSNVPWVRIPPSPFLQQKQEVRGMRTTRHSLVEGERERAEGEDLTAKWQSH